MKRESRTVDRSHQVDSLAQRHLPLGDLSGPRVRPCGGRRNWDRIRGYAVNRITADMRSAGICGAEDLATGALSR